MDIVTFQRKPEFLSAARVTTEGMAEVAAWCGGKPSSDGRFLFVPPSTQPTSDPTPRKTTRAAIGDWVVMDDLGDFYAAQNGLLYKAYEPT